MCVDLSPPASPSAVLHDVEIAYPIMLVWGWWHVSYRQVACEFSLTEGSLLGTHCINA